MKAILLAALAVSVAAVPTPASSCIIPAPYVTLASGACVGPAAGYNVFVDCLKVDGSAASTHQLTTTAADLLKFQGPVGAPGCIVAGTNVAFGTDMTMGTGVATCPALAVGNYQLVDGNVKALRVECATGFTGLTSGSLVSKAMCFSASTLATPFSNAVPASTVGQWVNYNHLLGAPTTCVAGCTLPSNLCTAGQINAALNVVANGANGQVQNCLLGAGGSAFVYPRSIGYTSDNYFEYRCPATGTTGAFYTSTGTLVANPPVFPSNGAVGGPRLTKNLPATGNRAAGWNKNFPTSATTLTNFIVIATGNLVGQVRATPAATFGSATSQSIDVTGCPAGATYNRCVQEAINYWRCHGFDIDSSTTCIANNVQIACPLPSNGFDCDDDGSKKGLLGLLGLLGIIPLALCCLLLCCLLFPCCIRRKKTEGDVHFATFDPHAAPVAATIAPAMCAPTAVCAPVDMCAPAGVCAEPFGTYGGGMAPFGGPATPIF